MTFEHNGIGSSVFGGSSTGIGVDGGSIASANLRVRGYDAARYPSVLRPSTSQGGKRRGA